MIYESNVHHNSQFQAHDLHLYKNTVLEVIDLMYSVSDNLLIIHRVSHMLQIPARSGTFGLLRKYSIKPRSLKLARSPALRVSFSLVVITTSAIIFDNQIMPGAQPAPA